MPKSLDDWLAYIEQLHPKSIEMGLARVKQICNQLELNLDCPIITVAGTNGKGSTAAMLESIYTAAGYCVGCYSSPHFIHYNERLKIKQKPVSDMDFCKAFEAVESARQGADLALTYFEFGTLAAVWLLAQQQVDVAILEVGLGGRLDAVNVFDTDCAIVTNIAFDHQDYLGNTRESIAAEKSGVFRSKKPAICGDVNPPKSLIDHANNIGADLKLIGDDFAVESSQDDANNIFSYHSINDGLANIGISMLELGLSGDFQKNNAACALTAVHCLQKQLPVVEGAMRTGLESVRLPGRFELLGSTDDLPTLLFDVAHNPNAATSLANNLSKLQIVGQASGPTVAVFGMLENKDWQGVIDVMHAQVDAWFVGTIDHPRGADASDLQKAINQVHSDASVMTYDSIVSAFNAAVQQFDRYNTENKDGKILIFGSFFTVSAVKLFLQQTSRV